MGGEEEVSRFISSRGDLLTPSDAKRGDEVEAAVLDLLQAGLTELGEEVGGDELCLRGRLIGTVCSGEAENLSFFVGVASRVGGDFLMVGVASADGDFDFLFLVVGVDLEPVRGDFLGVAERPWAGVCDWCSVGGVIGCLRGDLRRVGVTLEVGKVKRTTLSRLEEAIGDAVCGGV